MMSESARSTSEDETVIEHTGYYAKCSHLFIFL